MHILIHIFNFVYNQALRTKEEKKYKHWGKSKEDHTAVQILWQQTYGCFESSSSLSLQEYAYLVTLFLLGLGRRMGGSKMAMQTHR